MRSLYVTLIILREGHHYDEMTHKDIFNLVRDYRDMIKYWYTEEKEFAISDFADPYTKLSYTKIYNTLSFLFIKINIYQKSKTYYDSRTKPLSYKTGDMVYVRCHHKQNKALSPVWKGPYKIIRLNGNHSVTLLINRKYVRHHYDEIKLAGDIDAAVADLMRILSSPGLYFDKLLDIKFTNSDWNVIAYVDISHVQPNLDKVEFLFEKLNVFCNSLTSSKIQTDCINSLSALKNRHILNVSKFSSISYLLVDEKPSRRPKRGLMDIGGTLLKTIFGTLDSDDAVKFSKAIEEVQTDEKRLAHLMKDNIHVIKSTISYFNNTISKVNENENHILRNMETIHKILETVVNSNDKLEII
ncbi:hypothetical protein SFRURICE_017853 [Spodoptera frugiperda]|nr:hypothetical protein SFRURICE_017853 [Spodoptera frugiperda]